MRNPGLIAALAGALGFFGVAIGAFATHGVQEAQVRAWLDLGARYQLIHALAVFAALGFPRGGAAAWLFVAGAVFFCGSLYALALGAPRWAGAVTPLGGLLFLAGWAALGWAGLKAKS